MRLPESVARMGRDEECIKSFGRKFKEKRSLVRLGFQWAVLKCVLISLHSVG